MTFAELSKKIATCYNSLPALIDALRDGFASVEGGGGSSDIEYSTEEKKIGKYNGKDLYQKSFYATFDNIASNVAQNVVSVADLNIDQVLNVSGSVNYYNGESWYYSTLGLYFGAYVYTNSYLQFIQTVTQQTTNRSYKIFITIQYTKV